jgi:hypothetical protein
MSSHIFTRHSGGECLTGGQLPHPEEKRAAAVRLIRRFMKVDGEMREEIGTHLAAAGKANLVRAAVLRLATRVQNHPRN